MTIDINDFIDTDVDFDYPALTRKQARAAVEAMRDIQEMKLSQKLYLTDCDEITIFFRLMYEHNLTFNQLIATFFLIKDLQKNIVFSSNDAVFDKVELLRVFGLHIMDEEVIDVKTKLGKIKKLLRNIFKKE